MNSFYSLEPRVEQQLAKQTGDTRYERIVCPLRDGHNRAGERIGELSVIVHPSIVKDFTFTWSNDILVSQKVLDIFDKHKVTGYETRQAKVSFSKRNQAHAPVLFELVVTGWGGWAALGAGLTLVESCPGCGHKVYAIAEPSRLIDPTAWDGSDLFIVWPLPGYQFASDRLASILRQEKVSGVKLLPASELPVKKGNHITPGSLALHMPERRARELGQRFGIS
jgi:hypothetical protein